MSTEHPCLEANRSGLVELTARLTAFSDEQLMCPMPADWTVAGVLGHLAFWDHRAVTLLAKWVAEGIGPSPVDTDVVNEATRPICNALTPAGAVAVTLECARAIQAALAALPAETLARIPADGPVTLDRAAHGACTGRDR
jgi:hypothetical protein